MFFEWSSMIFGEEKESKSKRNGKLSIKTAHVEPVSCLFWSALQRPRSQCIAAWCTCTSVSSSNCMIISHWSTRRARFMVNYYSCWSFPPLISPFIFIFSFLLRRSSSTFILARITENDIKINENSNFESISFYSFLRNSLKTIKFIEWLRHSIKKITIFLVEHFYIFLVQRWKFSFCFFPSFFFKIFFEKRNCSKSFEIARDVNSWRKWT